MRPVAPLRSLHACLKVFCKDAPGFKRTPEPATRLLSPICLHLGRVRSTRRAGNNPNCQSSSAPFSGSPLIELSLIIYWHGVKRNKQLSGLRPKTKSESLLRLRPHLEDTRRESSRVEWSALPGFRGEAEKCSRLHACLVVLDLGRPCQMTAKGKRRGQPRRGAGKLSMSPNHKFILAVSRRMSNIFLHRPQDVEKKGEEGFARARQLWNFAAIGDFSLETKRSAH